ncbi:uncharacterized protein [Halyomorpha halys]|uniref:uncharacterized protein isoform X2 n=1 Tax=Halyomorpha halys TaxID=286706 RepID=UPI0006D518E7|nr:uncharacterized protein LOC106686996 isoform X2 [Halyomorpha halys]
MVLQVAKSSPSLVDLKETAKRKKFILPKKKYVFAYDDVAAFKRREKTEYEVFVNKITSIMLEEFVDYLKKEKCSEKIEMKKESRHPSDMSQFSLVSPAPSVSVIDDEISFNLSSLSKEEHEHIEKKNHSGKKSPLSHKSQDLKEGKQIEKSDISQKIPENLEEAKNKNITGSKKKSISETKKNVIQTQVNEVKENIIKTALSEESLEEKIKPTEPKVEPSMESSPFLESDSLDVNVDVLFKNGNRYQGRLSCYLMEGDATYSWSDGTTYKGSFKDGIAEGLGLIRWPDGSWYDGEIKRNRRHGKGVSVMRMNEEPKMCFFGNWKNGRTNGKVYSGYWNKGKREGKGTYVWRCVKGDGFVHPMQNTFIGQWKKGFRHGQGSLLLANGAMIHTVWVEDIKEGPGQIICKNGLVIQSSHLFKADKVYNLDVPIMIPFWNTWYCNFLSSYRSGLFYVQKLEQEEDLEEGEKTEEQTIVPQETPDKYNICSNNIPIFAPVESLPLWDMVMKTVCQPIPDLTGEISYIIRPQDVELLSTEEMWLRKVITNRMADINCLYQHYATIACEKKPTFKACMFRIMLWQMCRDSGVDETCFSLCELDRETGCDSYPFAIVLVFQMIHYLLILAYELCVKKRLANKSIPGKWGGAFDYFLTNYALPGMQKTTQIPELCNTIPLRNILTLYEDIGVPVTTGKVLRFLISNPIKNPQKFLNKIGNQIYGQNKVYPDGRIIFEEVGGTMLGTVFDFQDPDEKYLGFDEIKLLGKRELASNLFKICPKAKDGNIPKPTYEISFLEFCEFIKICLQKYNAILDPDTEVSVIAKLDKCDFCNKYVEIERHYELEHKTELIKHISEEYEQVNPESFESNYEIDESPIKNDLDGNHRNISYEGCDDVEQESIHRHERSHLKQFDGCPCKENNLFFNNESSITKICNCEETCDCSCNVLKDLKRIESFEIIEDRSSTSTESSIPATGRQFKDAKVITIMACDSDCDCFCHKIPESHSKTKIEDSDFELGISEEEESFNESLLNVDSGSSFKISDAINYLCGKTGGEEEAVDKDDLEMNLEEFSEEESTSDRSTDLSELALEEIGNELGEEELSEEDNIVAGEDFIETTKQFLSDLDNIQSQNNKKVSKKIYEKLLQYNCPIFKINYSEFFKNINTKGMTPEELRNELELEGPDDPFEEQAVEDIEKEIVTESLKVIKLVAKQRLYEKLLMEQFKKTVSQTQTGEYWEHFIQSRDCSCLCKDCLAGDCIKKKNINFIVKEKEYELSSDSSVSII